jgi:hypothetical protein
MQPFYVMFGVLVKNSLLACPRLLDLNKSGEIK